MLSYSPQRKIIFCPKPDTIDILKIIEFTSHSFYGIIFESFAHNTINKQQIFPLGVTRKTDFFCSGDQMHISYIILAEVKFSDSILGKDGGDMGT